VRIREENVNPNRKWLTYLPAAMAVLVLCLMGWGLFLGVSSLIKMLRPAPPGETSIALSAGFVRPRPVAEPEEPTGVSVPASELSLEPAPPAVVSTISTISTDGNGKPDSTVAGSAEDKPPATEKPKKKEAAVPPVFEIRGSVQRAGQPIQRGKVRLTVSLVGERFRQTTLADLNGKGEFEVYDYPAFQVLQPHNRIRVLAEVWPAANPDGSEKPLTETIYINHPLPSWIRSSTGYGLLIALLVLAILFLWAFTGRSTYSKNRLAIILSYSVIFLSLSCALVGPTLLMLAIPDLPDISGKVPVGLVVARLTQDSKPQWMLNIGGYVESGDSAAGAVGNGEDGGLSTPVLRIVTLNGGIQIPLYVILLAVIGGAINMTRQVPDFQSRQPGQPGLLHRMWSPHAPDEEKEEHDQEGGERESVPWRKGLLEQYMFLIAAPFLAIATYYLLVLLGTIQPPIIVLVCFSIGLISDTVVTAITEAAKKLLGGRTVREEPAAPSAPKPQRLPAAPPVKAAVTVTEGEAATEDGTRSEDAAQTRKAA
jgi:hypothetical protein